MTATETNWVELIGKPAFESIREMVAALECDYDRLEELRDASEAWDMPSEEDGPEPANDIERQDGTTARIDAWAEANPDDAEELRELESDAGECDNEDDARTRIEQDPLTVRVFGERVDGEWQADKFEILLTTGGPAVRIMGELNDYGEPSHAWLEVQDWHKPWTEYYTGGIADTLLAYSRCFYFAE